MTAVVEHSIRTGNDREVVRVSRPIGTEQQHVIRDNRLVLRHIDKALVGDVARDG